MICDHLRLFFYFISQLQLQYPGAQVPTVGFNTEEPRGVLRVLSMVC